MQPFGELWELEIQDRISGDWWPELIWALDADEAIENWESLLDPDDWFADDLRVRAVRPFVAD